MALEKTLNTRDGSKRSRKGDRRAEIVAAAAGLFDRGGYSNASMDELAAVVGIAKPTIYYYFRSKEAILFEIHEAFITLLIDKHKVRMAAGMGPRQELLEVMGDILELMETHRGHVRVFFEHHRELPPENRKIVAAQRDEYHAMVKQVVQDGVDAGELRDVDVELTTLALFGMCNWAYQWYGSGGHLRPREIAYVLYGILFHGIGAADGRGPRPSGSRS